MGLTSRLFTDPPDPRLDACLVDDAAHIFQGADGSHVACIQIALSLLSDGQVFLVIDGVFGDQTSQAVFDFKDERGILAPGEVVPNRIVGKGTIKALDEEMEVFENQSVATDELVASTVLGAPHDHSLCPTSGFSAPGSGGRVNHFGTPVNPLPGRSINISGEHETDYLGFEDFTTGMVLGPPRPLTSIIPDHTIQNICLRDSPFSMDGSADAARDEILRIAAPDCRLTFCGDVPQYRPQLLSLGVVHQHMVLADPRFTNPATATAEVLIIAIP
ncbi:hypothetical protein QWJ90_00585 [Microbacterium oryzae]|uniref:peptidoglycan-binding domain-containing protein n=1 Tax=Microbacterium oryzae TaxID=743009 RepID=UPI0025B16A0E|nr:hypothetical protein [Microbacterium oryzae]MDN3309425.1 hypothetical protein [Microbacterium oryzae]